MRRIVTAIILVLSLTSVSRGVWLRGWPYRAEIVIPPDNVDGDLTDYPKFIEVTADSNMTTAQADGDDLRFTLADGITVLYAEDPCASWSGGDGNAVSFRTVVKVPTISSTSNTTLYMYWGNPTATAYWNSPYDANFMAVWHFEDTSWEDATGRGHTLTPQNNPTIAVGKVGNCVDLTPANSYLTAADHADWTFDADYTIQVWAKASTTDASLYIVNHYDITTIDMTALQQHTQGAGCWRTNTIVSGSSSSQLGTSVPSTTAFVSVAGGRTAADMTFLFVNGSSEGTPAGPRAGALDSSNVMAIGADFDFSPVWGGYLDELQISNKDRGAAWLKFFTYEGNESDHEISIGAAEMSPQWLTGWSYRTAMVIPPDNVDEDLTNYPKLIEITSDANMVMASRTGADLRFTSDDGVTLLNVEDPCATWSGGGGSAVSFRTCVQIPTISSTANTTVYCYWGNPTATAYWNSPYDANFMAVWHFEDTSWEDATGRGHTLTPQNSPTIAVGKVGNCVDLTPANSYLTAADSTDWTFDEDWSIDSLVKAADADAVRYVFRHLDTTGFFLRQTSAGAGYYEGRIYAGAVNKTANGTAPPSTVAFEVLSCGRDTSGKVAVTHGLTRFLSAETVPGQMNSATLFYVGVNSDLASHFAGYIDETRVSNKDRGAAWLKFWSYEINEADHEITDGTPEVFRYVIIHNN